MINDLETNLDNKIDQVFPDSLGYTKYKKVYIHSQSFGFNGGLYDGQYLILKDNKLLLGMLYRENFNALNILFFRYLTDTDVRYGANTTISYFNDEELVRILNIAKSDIQSLES